MFKFAVNKSDQGLKWESMLPFILLGYGEAEKQLRACPPLSNIWLQWGKEGEEA